MKLRSRVVAASSTPVEPNQQNTVHRPTENVRQVFSNEESSSSCSTLSSTVAGNPQDRAQEQSFQQHRNRRKRRRGEVLERLRKPYPSNLTRTRPSVMRSKSIVAGASANDESSAEEMSDSYTSSSTSSSTGSFEARKRKRAYRYVNRPKATLKVPTTLTERRKSEAEASSTADTASWRCCKKLRCFRNADQIFLKRQREYVLSASQMRRKEYLRKMLGNGRRFYFNGKPVCVNFLLRAFRFSKDLQRSVKGTPLAPATAMVRRTPREVVSCMQRQRVVSFLRGLADRVGDRMPDCTDVHLPFAQKKQVYEILLDTFREEKVFTERPPSFSYFTTTWNEFVGDVKVRKFKRFTKCTDCEMFRDGLSKSYGNERICEKLRSDRKSHLKMVTIERAAYVSRCRRAVNEPMNVCSIVVDGADQTSFGLPHFVHKVKSTAGEALKVKLVGLLEHRPIPLLSLYVMTAQFETGANHIIEVIHRWINTRARGQRLPQILLVQLDNCTRENKNRYVFGYLESLVAWGVFVEVQVSFLPIGHTHSDIDQKFSCTSRRLKDYDAITMADLHRELQKSYTPKPKLVSLKSVANFSGLLESEGSLRNPPNFSHFQYFRFTRGEYRPISGTGSFSTVCAVKVFSTDDWSSLFKNDQHGFLLQAPNMRTTPTYKLKELPDREKVEMRIESEEGRINNHRKTMELRKLVEEVYRGGELPFSWDMQSCIESKGMRKLLARQLSAENDDDVDDLTTYIPRTRVDYKLNAFAVVAPDEPTKELPFWLGKIEKKIFNACGDVSGVYVRWYEPCANQNAFHGRYKPSDKYEGETLAPWFGEVNTDAVLFQIETLTKAMKIGYVAVRRIQEIVQI